MNVSATLNFLRVIGKPSLCLPHATIPTFNDLPIPLSDAFGTLKPDIRAVVLDKDDCFAVPKENVVYKPYTVGLQVKTFVEDHREEIVVAPHFFPKSLSSQFARSLIFWVPF